jgi:transcriptional regulator with XRE-family HTH domain
MKALDQSAAVKRLLDEGVSQRQVVARLGVSKGAVWRISKGKSPHVSRATSEPRRPLMVSPEDAAKLDARLSAVERAVARLLSAEVAPIP